MRSLCYVKVRQMGEHADELRRRAEKVALLEECKDKVEELLYVIGEVESLLPNDIAPSHHSEMEWGAVLDEINEKIEGLME